METLNLSTATVQEKDVIKTDILKIKPSLIVIENPNIREGYSEEAFQQLKESIRVNGIIQPIQVRKKKDVFVLVHGFNRFRAVQELISEGVEIKRVLAIPSQMSVEEELINHVVSNSGVPLTKYEISKVVISLSNFGYSNKEMSLRLGFSEMEVSNLLTFQRFTSMEVKNSVKEGSLAITTAIQLTRETETISEQNDALKEAKTKLVEGKTKISSSDILETAKAKAKKISFEKRFGEVVEQLNDEKITSLFYMLSEGKTTEEIVAFMK